MRLQGRKVWAAVSLAAWSCVVSAAPGSETAEAAPVPDNETAFASTVRPFLARNCLLCHNAKAKTAGLDLEAFDSAAAAIKDIHTWEKVAANLRTGQMPPAPLPRPSAEELTAVTEWIAGALDEANRLAVPEPGRVTARRLNRTEYNNTVRDLLGVDIRPADDFPQDDSGYGFDNIGDVLSLSPVLMERYLAAAEKVTQVALFGLGDLKPSLVKLQPRTGKVQPVTAPLFDYDPTGLSMPNAVHATHRFPVEGEYVLRVILGGFRPPGSDPIQIGVWVDGKQVATLDADPEKDASFELDQRELYGQQPEVRLKLTVGEHRVDAAILRLYEGLPASYGGPNPSKRPAPPPLEFKPRPEWPPEKVEEIRKRFEARQKEKKAVNEARVSRVDVLGPYNPVKGPSDESLRKILTCGHLRGGHGPQCTQTVVADLARRAFRRPVQPQELTPLVRLAASARKRGESFEAGIALATQAILVSPDFLFRIEKDQKVVEGAAGHPVSDHELASRLSYFLWASMPDEELLRCADQGRLRQPEVLSGQVRRMLADEKAEALVQAFGGQWLQFRALESAAPDRDRFPEFDHELRLAMRRETEMFFENIVREDRSILEFLDAKYSFLNERLARHYGVSGVEGPEFRRVDLSGTHRGGVLTQASVLTVSSYPTRTSPVLRGKWILENLLNAPPPPPPAGVPRLDEATVGASASLREQMEAHRNNAICASCHVRMDPLGFGLENYDAIGRWRTQDGKFPVNPAGALPDGRSFQGPDELKVILGQDREAFAEGITDKLLTYALGRGLERYDKPTVKGIARKLAESDYRFSALVQEIVTSMPFQMRRGESGKS